MQEIFFSIGRSSGQLEVQEVVHKERTRRGYRFPRCSVHYAGPFFVHSHGLSYKQGSEPSKDGSARGGAGGGGGG